MATRNKKRTEKEGEKGRVKIGKLNLNVRRFRFD